MSFQTTKISKELSKRSLDASKLRYCYECGTCTSTCPVVRVFPRHYNPRVFFQKFFLDLEDVLGEVGLWLCARCYRCYDRCPQELKLPEIFVLVRELAVEKDYLLDAPRKLREALNLLRQEFPFAATYSWLCLRPCEEELKRSKVDKLVFDTIQSFVGDYEKEKTAPIPKTRKEKIAIIGSGPAGLTAAYDLTRMGFPVTVFESLPEPGGMLRVGIPQYRLPKEVLDAEIRYIKNLGIEIRTNTAIGKDLTFDDLLKSEHAAILIAVGAHKSGKLGIEGEELKGVIHALDLLSETNRGRKVRLGAKVAVIGGGNVAMDAARTALRLGPKEVCVLYRRSREEMPANPWEVKEAEEEGVNIQFLVSPSRILGEDGHVAAIECIRMMLGEPDETGRRRPIPIKGSEYAMTVDTVIPAIGETPDLSFLPKDVAVTRRNTVLVDPVTLETSLPGVFAGGDVISGPATVIEAIAAGKMVADSISQYLKGGKPVNEIV
ncbi:MAG: Sulfide dehydrogenase subunit alpha precursor [Candidatus Bathyarchaeota archaeon BA2]|nr:MAG: Sulfide dehydrogenase subunit alpha precursor [Candidatus Bathyarchaeota archaeon BA2]